MHLDKKWDIYLIHHAHTDIGYTELQDKIMKYHIDYIRQAITILNESEGNPESVFSNFKWQCENHWQVENFYSVANAHEKSDFERHVKKQKIGLSGNYLNFTELISEDVLCKYQQEMNAFSEKIDYPINSAMTADINGYAWGYADALFDYGVENLFSCVHTHHGMFPVFQKQIPFFWESPKGNNVLVWLGDHYFLGNELFFAPHAGTHYMIQDEYSKLQAEHLILCHSEKETEATEFEITEVRLQRYLKNLELEQYPYSFVPCMISGAVTDNSPPNKEIAKRIDLLNEKYDGQIRIQMVTLEEFFHHVRAESYDIPVYKGDWNDWWADGIGSTPAAVKLYKDALRKYDLCKKLFIDKEEKSVQHMNQAAEKLALYSEHTWGHSSSVLEPWDTKVSELEMKKTAYAVDAHNSISLCLDNLLDHKGQVSIRQNKKQIYGIINPHDVFLETIAIFYIEFWEYIEGISFNAEIPIEVYDIISGELYQHQVKQVARAYEIEVLLKLFSKEEKTIGIRLAKNMTILTTTNFIDKGSEGVSDLAGLDKCDTTPSAIETPFFKISFDTTNGISSIFDVKKDCELIDPNAEHALFIGIYEITNFTTNDSCQTRREMGRNRKSPYTKRYVSKLNGINQISNGSVYTELLLEYHLEGTGFYKVLLKIYKTVARIDTSVRIHKHSLWEPENLYVALPLTAGENEIRYIDKTGCILRPGIDQLPGSNQEYYLVQNAVVMRGIKKSVVILLKDAPLVTFGDLNAKQIKLCTQNNYEVNHGVLYSWVMNNFWETNFKADLGGFYEFSYSILLTEPDEPQVTMNYCKVVGEGFVSFPRNN